MAVQTIYITNGASVAPGWFGPTQLNGTAPTAANSNVGWTPGKSALTSPYYRGRLGSTTTTGTTQAASWNASTSSPTAGTSNTSTTAGDSFIAGPFTGAFAATAWTFNWNMRATTAGCVGHVNMRMWRGTNASGSGATQVLANTAGATVTLSTTADTNSSITASPGAMTLNNEYLFFQVEWQETTVGTSNSDNVFFRIGTASITTADYTPVVVGNVNFNQATQQLNGTWLVGDWVYVTATASGRSTNPNNVGPAITTAFAPGMQDGRTANLIILSFSMHGAFYTVPLSVTDNQGNTYLPAGTYATTGSEVLVHIYYCLNPVLSDTHRWTLNDPGGSALQSGVVVGVYASPPGTFPFFDQATSGVAGTNTCTPGAITPPPNALLVTHVGCGVAGSTINSNSIPPFYVSQWTNYGTTWEGAGQAIFSPGVAAGAVNPTWTIAGATVSIAKMASFTYSSGPSGTLNVTELPDALAATGNVPFLPVTGIVSVTELPDTLAATGTVPLLLVTGTLNVTELPDSLTAAGGPRVGGTLNLPQAPQTLVAAGGPRVSGTLNQPQAPQTLVAAGGPRVSGTLNLPQANQTLVAAANTVVIGTLNQPQAAQTLAAAGGPRVGGTLTAPQANQTLTATAVMLVGGTLNLPQAPQTLVAAGGPVLGGLNGTLNLTETPDALLAHGTVANALDPTLIAYWKLSDGSGTDQSNHSNDGVFNGATPTTGVPMGNGATFATGNYIANDQVINIPYVTVAVWVRPIPSGRNQQIVGFADGFAAGTTDKDLVLNANGTISWYIYVSGGIWLSTTATVTDGNWHHVAGTYEDGTIAIYIDGVLSASTPGYGGSFAGYGQPNVFLGGVGHQNAHGDDWYGGSLADFRLYNRALTAAEVSALYVSGNPVTWGDGGGLISLSNGGLDAFCTTSSGWSSVRARFPRTTGQYYFEVEYTGNAGSPYFGVGVMDDSTPAGGGLDSFLPYKCGGTRDDGYQFVNGFTGATSDGLGPVVVGDRIGGAVNLDTQELYLSHNGVGIGASNPLTRANPRITWYGQAGINIFPAAFLYYTGARIHGKAVDQAYPVPLGYTAWGDIAPLIPATGDLTANQANQTLAATATVLVRGILTPQMQADQTLAATGALTVGGALTQPQAAQTLTAHGTVLVTGALAQPQGGQTITALGGVIVGGTLNQPQAPQTLVAAGGPRVSGILNQPQAPQTLAATAGPVVTGALNTLQADQTVSAHGGPFVLGTLITPQAAQTLIATAGPVVIGTLTQPQAAQTLAAAGTLTLRGTLTVSQADQALAATASVLTGVGGSLDLAQASQTLAATATVPIWVVGNLNTGQAAQTVSAHGGPRIGGTLSATQADQVVAATASAVAGAALVTPQAAQTLVALGGVLVTGHLTQPQAPHTLIAGAGPVNYANLTANQANQTIAATATVLVRGRLTATQDDHSFAGVLVAPLGGALAIVQDAQVLVTTGTVEVRGTLVLLEHSDTVTALGATSIGAALNLTERSDTLAGRGGSAIEAALTVVETDDILTAVASAHDFNADLFIRQADQRVYAWGYLGDQMPALPVAGTGTGRYIVVGTDDRTVAAGPTDRLAESVAVNRTAGNGAGVAMPARTVTVGGSKRAA